MTGLWPVARLAVALLCLAAIVRQLIVTVGNAQELWPDQLPTVISNYFSYFTILSNLGAVVTLVLGAIWALRTRSGREAEPAWLATLFVCVSTYMIVTGVVYNLLLRSSEITGLAGAWTNEVLHVVGPVFLLVDALVAPRRRGLPWRTVGIAAAFPIAWALYTLLRANLVSAPVTGDPWWYPYPFLDPHLVPGGYLGVAGYIVGIAVVVIAVAAAVTWARHAPGRLAAPSSTARPGPTAGS